MWAALAACILKRLMAKGAQRGFNAGEVSTRKTVMAIGHHPYALLDVLLRGAAFREALIALFRHLSTQALRAHPERDRPRGRLRLGILPVIA
jgi:transketolase N-terminal domain/subunit